MSRIAGVNPENVETRIARVLEAQAKRWGAPLLNHLVYARRPAIFRGVRGMWSALDECAFIETALQALVNRRVAFLNHCEF